MYYTQEIKMLSLIAAYVHRLIGPIEMKPKQTYGSELERYIMSHNPQSNHDVERLTRQFDKQLSQGRIL
jgi:hypothetical protein